MAMKRCSDRSGAINISSISARLVKNTANPSGTVVPAFPWRIVRKLSPDRLGKLPAGSRVGRYGRKRTQELHSIKNRKNPGLTGSQCSILSEVWKHGQLWTLSQMDRTAEHSRNEWPGPNYSDRKLPK
ncbi:hypothetical protein PO909_021396 [Leuciscus waleckii]